ncbi:MAG TPA: M28 family peptidase, partial [Candidatus Saccharimonadales bacterium]|nr:M28 family peptidase [Candidatus Saccharimonadales bacterium]
MSRFPSLLFATCATGLVVAAAAWLQGAPEGAGGEPGGIQELAARPEVARALAAVDAQKDRILQDWIDLASTPSFSGDEGRRAEIVESRMKAAGLEDVHRDAAGNVMGILPGLDRKAKRTVFMAHMDTVAKPGADFTVRREDGILRGPGVRDDSSGLSATLTAARLAG